MGATSTTTTMARGTMRFRWQDFLVYAVVGVLTVVRIYLGHETPLLLQPDASYDDMLVVNYATSMLDGQWLGSFCYVTYAKACASAALLALGYVLGIPYGVSLVVLYALACAAIAIVLYQLSRSRALWVVTYLVLLYLPVMFHEENVQKLYRGGFIVSFALLVFAAYLGMYATRSRERIRAMVGWSIVACLSLPVFWFLKEDSIWLLPYVAVACVVTATGVVRHWHASGHALARVALIVAPLLVLVLASTAYKFVNSRAYGVYAITDRNETNYHNVMADLMLIDDPDMETVWITRRMMERAMEASPTLETLHEGIDDMYEKGWADENGEISGDIMFWSLREVVRDTGLYDQGAQAVDDFYARIHQELSDAFGNGTLEANRDLIRLSDVAHGFTAKHAIAYYLERLPQCLADFVAYRQNVTDATASHEPMEDLQTMADLSRGPYLWPGEEADSHMQLIVNLECMVVRLYQLAAWPLLVVGVVGNLLLLVQCIAAKPGHGTRDESSNNQAPALGGLLLASVAAVLTLLVLLVGVMWFANFLSDRKVYDYVGAGIPLLALCECIGLWNLCRTVAQRH